MSFVLPRLPYDLDSLEPHISKEAMSFHYEKHHATYVKKLNDIIVPGHAWAGKTLEEVTALSETEANTPVFNNAAQTWNHTFFWQSMTPNGGGIPKDTKFMEKIMSTFGSFDVMKEQFLQKALGVFGSGWAWLVLDENGNILVEGTSNAQTPMTNSKRTPLLTCDVWEHAYYIDYRNKRPDFVEVFLSSLANWDMAARLFASAEASR